MEICTPPEINYQIYICLFVFILMCFDLFSHSKSTDSQLAALTGANISISTLKHNRHTFDRSLDSSYQSNFPTWSSNTASTALYNMIHLSQSKISFAIAAAALTCSSTEEGSRKPNDFLFVLRWRSAAP